jgi:phytoene synthase
VTDPTATAVHPGGARPPLAAPHDLRRSFAVCRAVTARANSSFPLAFRLLPPAKRRAMDALYAFMRITDDLADEPAPVTTKRANLATWRAGLSAALDGRFTHPLFPALAATVHHYGVPVRYLNDVIDGVEADLEPVRYATFADLYPYCYRVASAVGLACVRVWGTRPGATFEQTLAPAEAAGIAFQLTNILRDLGEDAANGRVYLPLDELARFNCEPGTWDARSGAFGEMMRFQAARAWEFYRRAEPLGALLTSEGRAIYRVMCGTYRGLLTEIERRGFDVLSGRVRVAKWRKAAILLGGWATKLVT